MSLENPCTFLIAKEKTWKRIFNTNSELSQNRTEKQIMLFKTTVKYWLFNDIYMILFSHWLFWLQNWRFSTSSCNLVARQYSGNIRWMFPQRCDAPDIQGTFREHFQGKYFLTNPRWKSYFCVKNVWFDENKCWSFGKFQ